MDLLNLMNPMNLMNLINLMNLVSQNKEKMAVAITLTGNKFDPENRQIVPFEVLIFKIISFININVFFLHKLQVSASLQKNITWSMLIISGLMS